MADFSEIIQEINTNLPDNNTQAITAEKLRTTLINLTETIEDVQTDFEEGVNATLSDIVVDNLTSTDTDKALSANQGNVLNKSIIWKNYEYKQDVSASHTDISEFVGIPIGTTIYVYPDSTSIRLNGSVDYNYSPGTYFTTSVEVNQFWAVGAGRAHFIINPNHNLTTLDDVDNNIYYKLNQLQGYELTDTKHYTSASGTGGSQVKNCIFGGKLLIKNGQTYHIKVSSDDLIWESTGVRIYPTTGISTDPNYHPNMLNGVEQTFTAVGDISNWYVFVYDASFVDGATSADVVVNVRTDAYEIEVPDNSITNNKIVDDTIAFEKIAFKETLPVTKNLFNPNAITSGFINSSGGRSAGAAYVITDYIPVNTNGLYNNNWIASSAVHNYVYYPDKTPKRDLTAQYVYQEGDEGCYVRYTIRATAVDTTQIEVGTSGTSYVEYQEKTVISPSVIMPYQLTNDDFDTIQGNVESYMESSGIVSTKVDVDLPDVIYAVRGDTLQLFYQGMIKCVNPEVYDVLITCSVGAQYHRYYEYVVPSNATLGDYPFTLTVKDSNGNVLGTKSTVIRVVKSPVSPSTNKNIFCIGDSLSDGGEWQCEANRRLVGTGGTPSGNQISNITFVGRLSETAGGITTNFEGKSGYGWKDFVEGRAPRFRFYLSGNPAIYENDVYSNNGFQYTITEIRDIDGVKTVLTTTSNINNIPETSGTLTKVSGGGDSSITYTSMESQSDNPLWDGINNRISFKYYMETVCGYPVGTNIDAVYSLLSWNQITGNNWETIIGYVKTFADTLHAEYPNCKFKLMAVQYPSMKLMMPVYGAKGTGYADVYRCLKTIYNMNQQYQAFANSTETSGTSGDAYNTFVEFVNVSSQFDSDYNNKYTLKNVNTRNSSYQEPNSGSGGVHPQINGYYQIADVAYRNIVASFCQ